MAPLDQEFLQRVSRVPPHGVGLSVDVYSPDLFELVDALESRSIPYGYLEIFKASACALSRVRRRLASTRLAYHAEGLWLTQPDWRTAYPWQTALAEASAQAALLDSAWLNHECATKQMAGYAFGTYVAPLFTRDSAAVTARNVCELQRGLDELAGTAEGKGPLLLLELPPLTYFQLGDMAIQEFFRVLADRAPCGLVLDVGHLWTIYRYAPGGRKRPLEGFLAEFLDGFPLHRVVQIHVAGLGAGASGQADGESSVALPGTDPLWIDAHADPIPAVLLEMLDRILAHPNLLNLRGVALEVDTKPVEVIAAELERFNGRYLAQVTARVDPKGSVAGGVDPCVGRVDPDPPRPWDSDPETLRRQYADYARVLSGQLDLSTVELPGGDERAGLLTRYRQGYLPHEILHWGGDLRELFPRTCRVLDAEGVALSTFVQFWFRSPRHDGEPYDFFLLKLKRFVEFIWEAAPHALPDARKEAEDLVAGYQAANELAGAGREPE